MCRPGSLPGAGLAPIFFVEMLVELSLLTQDAEYSERCYVSRIKSTSSPG